jgi:hypothetical protein
MVRSGLWAARKTVEEDGGGDEGPDWGWMDGL